MPLQYEILFHDLKKSILTGVIPEGGILPSEHELCREYSVTRSTVRKALDLLVNEGYIAKKQGKGSIVQLNRKSLGLLSFRGFSEVLGKKEQKIRSVFLQDPIFLPWPKNFFYRPTKEEQKTNLIFFHRLRFVDEEPVMLEHTYVPNIGLEDFFDQPLAEGSLFTTLRQRYEIEILNLSQDIKAIPADPQMSYVLDTPPGSPLILIYRRYSTNRENMNIYSSLYCNTGKYFLSSETE